MTRITQNQKYLLRLIIVSVACFFALLGGVTVLAWLMPNQEFQNLFGNFIYCMKYYTPVCFVLSAVGLLSSFKQFRWPTAMIGISVFAIGAITLVEYLTGNDFGFDQFLLSDFHDPLSSVPGRMAPGAALGFIFTGLQLLASLGRDRKPNGHQTLTIGLMELCGSLVFVLGAQEGLAHLLGYPESYSWDDYLHMAPQTAMGFLALGSGLLAYAWYRQNMLFSRVPLWLPGILCVLVLFFDIERPRGIGGGIIYVPLVFCSLWFRRPQAAFVFAGITTIMSVIAYFLKPVTEFAPWTVILNRTIVEAVIWFVATLVYRRRVGEIALHQSERRLSAIVDYAVDGLFSIDTKGVIEHFNPACERIFGYRASEVIGKNVDLLIPEFYQSEHNGYLTTGETPVVGASGREVSARRKDGSLFPMDLSISSFQLEDGRHFSSIVRDITTRKQAEEKNALLAAIIDSSEDAIISKKLDGTITSWNGGAERLFGYSAQEAIGKLIGLIIPPERMDEEAYIMQQLHENKQVEHFETIRRKKNGQFVDVSLTLSPIRNMAGQVVGASKILRDITLQKTIEAERVQYTEALEFSNKELDDFAYIASHDLKEPLRGLFNNAQFLLEDYKDIIDQAGVKRLERLGYLTQRMEQLINDLLYYSRLGRHDLAIQSADLNEVIHDIVTMMDVTLKEQNAVVRMAETLPTIICDKTRVTEVFRNLITNAVKYNDKAEKTIDIGVIEAGAPQGDRNERVFYVRDNGIGIKEEFFEEIFRIFKRLNSEEDTKRGTGVGLTFVRKIIARHGGKIWLESERNVGTIFYFTLPVPDRIADGLVFEEAV